MRLQANVLITEVNRHRTFLTRLVLLSMMTTASAYAANAGGGLPWEGPLTTIVNSITGPVAFAIAVFGIVGCGAGLLFGSDMNELLRKFLIVGVSVAMVVFAVNVLRSWFGFGAEIAFVDPTQIIRLVALAS